MTEDERALRDLARCAYECASREGVSPDVAQSLERGADVLTRSAKKRAAARKGGKKRGKK